MGYPLDRASLGRAATAAVLALVCACAAPPPAPSLAVAAASPGHAATIPIEVMKPEGDGPFPAVVLLHDCSGLGPRSSGAPRRWGRELVKQGYAVAIPDSFSTRGFPAGVCTNASPSRNDVGPFRRVRDAYEALGYLRSLPYVDGARVAVMGGSHGGASVVAAIALLPRESGELAEQKRHGFVAAIAFYPACAMGNPRFTSEYHPAAPLLILVGELDDWTPAAPCKQMAEAARRVGGDVRIKVYPGAHHAFDSNAPVRYVAERVNGNAPGGRGATTGGNRDAWDDSIREVRAFLAERLRPSRQSL